MHFFSNSVRSILVLLFATASAVAQNSTGSHSQPVQRVPSVNPAPGTNALADSIRAEQNGTLRALDMALLNSPAFTVGWNAMFRQIRYNSTVPGDIRELSILRISALQGAAYQWQQHEPVGRSEGLTSAQLKLIRDPTYSPCGSPAAAPVFNTKQPAAPKFADASTRNSHVSNDVWAGLAKQLSSPQQLTELALTVAGYNMVSRFLLAVSVDGVAEMQVPYPV